MSCSRSHFVECQRIALYIPPGVRSRQPDLIYLRRLVSFAVLRNFDPTKMNISLSFGEHVDRSLLRMSTWLVRLPMCLYREHEFSKMIHPLSELSGSIVGRVGLELRCCVSFSGCGFA